MQKCVHRELWKNPVGLFNDRECVLIYHLFYFTQIITPSKAHVKQFSLGQLCGQDLEKEIIIVDFSSI